MRVQSLLTLSIVLLIVAAIQSCKSPNAPTPTAPTLTLILPDSAHAYDTLTLRVHYSDSIKSTWLFAWQFGDSTKATTRDTFVSHIYDSAGTYTVQVTLTDTAAHQTIAKQTGQIKIMPFNGPTLTLTVPDTNYWGDSCVISVSSSQPLKAGWKYSWSLGDSTTVTGTDSVMHYYLTPGIYYVIVNLDDTVRHIYLASKIAKVPVVARHFNLALLQSMKYVDYTDNGTIIGGGFYGGCYIASGEQLSWNGLNLSWDSSYSFYTYDTGSFGWTHSGNGNESESGVVDSFATNLVDFSESINTTDYDWENNGETGGTNICGSDFSISKVPFVEESDSEVIFQSSAQLINASAEWSLTQEGRMGYKQEYSAHEVWTNPNSRITIRFHK